MAETEPKRENLILSGGKCVVIYKNNGKSYSYHHSKVETVQSALQTLKSANIFSYLKPLLKQPD